MQIMIIEGLLLVFLIVVTITIIFTKDLLASIITYAAFSFCAMLLYIVMGAADVAFTEAVIGVVSTIYFVIAMRKIGRNIK
ncbi:MAG: hydrogenase subunit MbhD domain-containing protein [Anaerovoracaceae bacterium]